jgi:hypothetical protein
MNCKQARGKLALLIGSDLDASAVGEVQKHLSQCAGCREHLQQLSSCLEVLQVPAAGAFNSEGESLWPRISVRLVSPSSGERPHRLSGWAPTLAVAAAVTVMFWASSQFMTDSAPSGSGGPIPYQQQIDEPVRPRGYNSQGRPVEVRPDSTRPAQPQSDRMRSSEDGAPVIPVNESR